MAREGLERLGWNLQDEALVGLGDSLSAESLQEKLLDMDIRKIGRPALPADINTATSTKLQGPLVLQISGFCDVSGPIKYKVGTSSSKDRMMMVRLTDGVRECKAIECRRLSILNPKDLLPGLKVRVHGLAVRFGVIILQEKGFEILGGKVSNLVDAYEAQQLYGGPGRDAQQNKGDKPPTFKPFDPTRRRRKSKASDAPKKVDAPRSAQPTEESKDSGRQQLGIQKDTPPVKMKSAAAQTLLDRMESGSGGGPARGRGRRRRHHTREDNDASMTMDEWNAKQAKASGDSDHAIAVAMQEQFDLEDQEAPDLSADILGALYATDRHQYDDDGIRHHGRGRGGRGRGRRGRGRRGHGRKGRGRGHGAPTT